MELVTPTTSPLYGDKKPTQSFLPAHIERTCEAIAWVLEVLPEIYHLLAWVS